MPTVYYTYEKGLYVEDEIDIPQRIIDDGERSIKIYIEATVEAEDYSPGSESEETTIKFKVAADESL